MKKKKKRGEEEFLDEGRPYVTKVFAKFSHDAPVPVAKKKHLTVEQLNARRRKVWLTVAKKEIPKVSTHGTMGETPHPPTPQGHVQQLIQFLLPLQSFKQKTSAKNLVLTNAKKVRTQRPLAYTAWCPSFWF